MLAPAFQTTMSILPARSGALPARASLEEFKSFHGMLVSPPAAQRCIRDFNGCILFMPHTYGRDVETFPVQGKSPFEVTVLNLFTYYLLVLATNTGLSTLVQQTDFVDSRETSDFVQAEPFWVDPLALEYISRHGQRKLARSGVESSSVKLARRFEYNFRLADIRVAMFHFASVTAEGDVALDSEGKEILHLVEVYQVGGGSMFLRQLLRLPGLVSRGFGFTPLAGKPEQL
mmetsp:Transcript_43565/g.102380  ORF Transcript_43565/g.102380 Transcript_43565/m.102380 type:complete len:231 (-) Transcript_43565:329-1021(-)